MPTIPTLIDFETQHPGHDWIKEEKIRDELGITPARYYVLLHRAAMTAEGIRHNALTCGRIRAQIRNAA